MADVEPKLSDTSPKISENVNEGVVELHQQTDDSWTEPVGGSLSENGVDSEEPNAENSEKEGRRVKFPEGSEIILAYHEYPSPWHNGKLQMIACKFQMFCKFDADDRLSAIISSLIVRNFLCLYHPLS